MVSVSEAKQIIQNCVEPLAPVTVALQDASALVLAEDIIASVNIPAFNQSSMDGYAICFKDCITGKALEIAGEIPAGANKNFGDLSGKAVRIFTGAPVPEGADTVVMQEKVTVQNKTLFINATDLTKGSKR